MTRWSLVIAFLAAALSVPAAQPRSLVLEGGTLIDGTGRPPITDAMVVVEGARIAAVGRRGALTRPAGATVIDTTDRTIVPGFVDGHVHLRDYQIPMFLPYGITTIADIHNDTAWSLAQREALRTGRMQGPRLFVSGARVTGPLGAPTTDGSFVRTPAEARAYVRSLKAAGVDHVKVDLTITDDQLRAVIEESKAQGLRVLGHTQNIRTAVEMGFTHMEHTDTMARSLLADVGRSVPTGSSPEAEVDPAKFPALIDFLVRRGVYVNPTLVLVWSASTGKPREWAPMLQALASDPRLAFVPVDVRAAWTRTAPRARPGYSNVQTFLRQYAEAGGKVLAASDAGCCTQLVPGLSFHQEIEMLVDAGIPPMKALQGATLWAAEVLGREREFGSVEAGKIADVAVLDSNPLDDIRATRSIRLVIKDGAVVQTTYDPQWRNPIPRSAGR